jgi:carbamoyl-phosphate synthase large subunit
VLVLGSGGLKIGQAGEFDYSGSQALKALREEGVVTVLINPNIATIQTSEGMADATYFLPVTPEFVERVIEKEKPDGILLSFGGQTALNCGVALDRSGVLAKHGVRVLGSPVRAIEETEDRDLFAKKLAEIGVSTARSEAASDLATALAAAGRIGYPVMLRAAYALGGSGSGLCENPERLSERCEKALAVSPQVLIEEWLGGWKEIEYEVVRDRSGDCITVCNMENLDPLGIHTGESIVVAPSQTLTDSEYHKLRRIALQVIGHLGIVGECNIQYALDPRSEDYRVIEVNARLSRSSALASKATGYPLAFVAAKLALGQTMTQIENRITRVTKSCFEPALDYCVVKVPRWDLGKFKDVEVEIGSEMKSVGEVMSIGRSFEEALQKALRMTGIGAPGLSADPSLSRLSLDGRAGPKALKEALRKPTDRRLFAVYAALSEGWSIDKVHELTRIDRWFLGKMANILACEKKVAAVAAKAAAAKAAAGKAAAMDASPDAGSARPKVGPEGHLGRELLLEAKRLGFSDARLAEILGTGEGEMREEREKAGIRPAFKRIDTLAAEYPAQSNYLYATYLGQDSDVEGSEAGVVVIGSGAYRIGSSVEFDWCCVNAVQTVRALGKTSIMVNCNPETVSTDYDVCDRLYFEELSLERVLDIYEFERPAGVILSMGGQTPNNLAMRLFDAGAVILGTDARDIDKAEDRHKFSALLESLGIEQPAWRELTDLGSAYGFADDVGYPVLVRPSYVLSGAAMCVAWDRDSLEEALGEASAISGDHPVVITKFIEDAKEVEIDAVARRGEIVYQAITEHVENAGVHSGDATVVLPPQRLYIETVRKVRRVAEDIARALRITGPFNIQFIAKDNRVSVIECNLRASRSFPFCSKVARVNMIELATKAILDAPIEKPTASSLDLEWVGVKAAQFSFSRLRGTDPVLGVEMSSTGEVGCIGRDLNDAFLKALLSVGYRVPKKRILLSTGPMSDKVEFLGGARSLAAMGYEIYASKGTAKFLVDNGVPATPLHWPLEKTEPNIATMLRERKFDLVINIPKNNGEKELRNDYIIRRMAVDFDLPLVTDIKMARRLTEALAQNRDRGLEVKAWEEYR